jgi:prepilin-type N-terminal cleavage/methylation domain-containing protein
MMDTAENDAVPGPRRDAGFTLLEVLVALAIISAVLTSMSVFFVRSMTSVSQQGDRQTAVRLAADGMERMREIPGALVRTWILARTPETITVNQVRYVRTWDTPRVVSVRPGLLYAVVRVTWPGKSCPASTCTYVSSTTIASAGTDPVFDPDRP